MAVRGAVTQHIGGVLFVGFLVEAVGSAAVEDARTEEAGHAGSTVAAEFAEGVLPFVGVREVHVWVGDLSGLVERKV
jgi:hypothetical protein